MAMEEERVVLLSIFGEENCEFREGEVLVRLLGQEVSEKLWLRASLPGGYPGVVGVMEVVSFGSRLDAEESEALSFVAQGAAVAGAASIYSSAVAASDALADINDDKGTKVSVEVPAFRKRQNKTLLRTLFLGHHLVARKKRKALKELSEKLEVSVLLKIGWPAIILLEGESTSVDAFKDVVTSWRRLDVRAEERDDVLLFQASRRLPPNYFKEFGPNGMNDLEDLCCDKGLEDLLMSIYGRRQEDKNLLRLLPEDLEEEARSMNFLCPITLSLMTKPVLLHTPPQMSYEEDAITSWLAHHPQKDPCTGLKHPRPLRTSANDRRRKDIAKWLKATGLYAPIISKVARR